MKRSLTAVSVVSLFAAAGAVAGSLHLSAQGGAGAVVSQAQYVRWEKELSNWGRWGPQDEMGALNFIAPSKRKAAAALVREGVTVSLASNVNLQKEVDVPCPAEWAMSAASAAAASDRIAYPCIHGAGATQIDSFAHIFFDGKTWNGYSAVDLVTREGGAARGSVLNMKHGIVTRAVLYDIPRSKGVPYLEPGIAGDPIAIF